MLKIRRFVKGVDEPIWVGILSESRKNREDWRAITAEEMLLQEQENPSFDPEGRFVAELEQRPVGVVHANVEKLREERTGFVRFDVIPESRGRGIERQLVETALRELKARGMAIAQASVDSGERGLRTASPGAEFRAGSGGQLDGDGAGKHLTGDRRGQTDSHQGPPEGSGRGYEAVDLALE